MTRPAILLAAAMLAGCSSAQPAARPEPKPAQAAGQDEAAFTGALVLATEDRADVDMGTARQRMERLEREVTEEVEGATSNRQLGEAVARVIFGRENFQVDPDDPEGRKLSSFDVPRVLERRRGACLPIAIIMARAASGAGLLAGVVRVPGHALVALGPPGDRIYLDPAERGSGVAWSEVAHARPWSAAASHIYNGHTLFGDEVLAQLRASRAAIRLAGGKLPAAEADARAALAAVPDLPEGLVNLGAILLRKGQLDEAWRLLMRAHDLLPASPVVSFNLGLAAAARGDPLAAISYYQAALEADPGMEPARANKLALEKELEKKGGK